MRKPAKASDHIEVALRLCDPFGACRLIAALLFLLSEQLHGDAPLRHIMLRAEARTTVKPEHIIEWAREHMAFHKVPRIVEFVDALPKSGSGKVMWRLRQEREPAA